MIIKGSSHSGKGLGAYLLQDKNDRAEVLGIRGDIARDLSATLDDWRSDALTTRCSKPLYHAQINPDRALSREEWERAVAIFEKEMGLENQPRAIVMHEYKGREHYHLVYSRIDENGKAISDSWNYLHHEKAAREIERELGLERTQGAFIDREGERPERTHSREEIQQGERLKLDPKEIKAEVSELYQSADNGREFVAGLEEAGYSLAQGDKRGYVILDQAGGVHSLSRMAGVKVADLRETLQEYPLQGLPTVEAAREMQRERQQAEPVREAEQTQQPDPLANMPKPEGERLQRMTGRYDPLNAEHEKAQAAPASGAENAPSRDDPAAEGMNLGAGAVNALADGLEGAVGGFFWNLAGGDPKPPPTPEQQQKAADDRAERLAAAEKFFQQRDEERQRQQEREQGKSLDRGRGRERER